MENFIIEELKKLPDNTISGLNWAAKTGGFRKIILDDGTVTEDTTVYFNEYNRLLGIITIELFSKGDETGFPKAQKFYKKYNLPKEMNIGDLLFFFIKQYKEQKP